MFSFTGRWYDVKNCHTAACWSRIRRCGKMCEFSYLVARFTVQGSCKFVVLISMGTFFTITQSIRNFHTHTELKQCVCVCTAIRDYYKTYEQYALFPLNHFEKDVMNGDQCNLGPCPHSHFNVYQ